MHDEGTSFWSSAAVGVLDAIARPTGNCTIRSGRSSRPCHSPSGACHCANVNPESETGGSCFVPISITGSGFGERESTSKVTVTNTTDSTIENYFADDDTTVVVWEETRIVIKLPCTLSHPQVTVYFPGGVQSATVTADRYEYDSFSTGNSQNFPLAVTNDGSKGYLLEEFSSGLSTWNLATGAASPASGHNTVAFSCFPNIQGPCFRNTFWRDTQPSDTPVPYTTLAESVIVDDDSGLIWFSQGGGFLYGDSKGNHSRIISFDPSFDPETAETGESQYRIYNVPGNNNQVTGIAWDKVRNRIWFASQNRSHCTINDQRITIQPTRLLSFNPDTVASEVYVEGFSFATDANRFECTSPQPGAPKTCSETISGTDTTQPCFSKTDCVLAEHICAPGAPDDTCFREYELEEQELPSEGAVPPVGGFLRSFESCDGNRIFGASTIGHLAVSSVDGSVWYSSYLGSDAIDENNTFPDASGAGREWFVGRLDPDAATDQERHFPVYNTDMVAALQRGSWDIAETSNGDMAFILDKEFSVARFDMSRVDDPACLDLVSPDVDCGTIHHETCENPCIDKRRPPGFTSQNAHSLAVDEEENIWFTLSGGQGGSSGDADPANSASVGFWKADRSGLVAFPSLSLFVVPNSLACDFHFGLFPNYSGFSGSGITVNENNGDVWFADFCRKHLGRLRIAEDSDADGVHDNDDNCPLHSNVDQADADGDGRGDLCDDECANGLDDDGDGKIDFPADESCDDGPGFQFENTDCSDGIDNDGDGKTDFPADESCAAAWSRSENAECSDGIDNDGDGGIDFPGDPDCTSGSDSSETAGFGCGLGFEIGIVMLPLVILQRRRQRSRAKG